MADDKTTGKAAAKKKNETIGGREVAYSGEGKPYWLDTGEETNEEELAYLRMIAADGPGFGFEKQTKQNPDLIFWKPEIQPKKDEAPQPNPIRGLVMAMFKRPDEFNTGGNQDDDEEESAEETTFVKPPKIACFFLITKPTSGVDRNGDVVKVPAGKMVWVDLNQSMMAVVQVARPRMDGLGQTIEAAEVAIEPKYKAPFKAKNGKMRQAWRSNVYGGRGRVAQREGYRIFDEAQIAAMGERALIPSLMNQQRAAEALGLVKPAAPPMLDVHEDTSGTHALPAHASTN